VYGTSRNPEKTQTRIASNGQTLVVKELHRVHLVTIRTRTQNLALLISHYYTIAVTIVVF